MLCPACQVDLTMSERQGIEIDYCPKCRGVWLDRGERDKIVERSAAREQEAARHGSQHWERQHPQKPWKGHYRRKSWLDELFD
jgi:uncharacterized protein